MKINKYTCTKCDNVLTQAKQFYAALTRCFSRKQDQKDASVLSTEAIVRRADDWSCPESNPIEDCKRALMLTDAMSEREAEIMIEVLMKKREPDNGLICDLMFGKMRKRPKGGSA